MLPNVAPAPGISLELDRKSLVSLKTIDLPMYLKTAVVSVLNQFKNRQELQKTSEYYARLVRLRSCSEKPEYLASTFLPEKTSDTEKSRSERVLMDNSDNDSHSLPLQARNEELDLIHRKTQFIYTPAMSVASLVSFNSHFASAFRVLRELKERLDDFNPQAVLDYGAGHGCATSAAVELWPTAKFTMVEPNANQMRIAKFIGEAMTRDRNVSIDYLATIYGGSETFDLVICSYVMLELLDTKQRDMLVDFLWRRVSSNGIMVFIETGTPTGFRYIHSIREKLLKETKCTIIAPCPHESTCPMALTGRDWCHFPQQVKKIPGIWFQRSQNFQTEKFSYLVIQKNKIRSALGRQFDWPRVVLHPMKRTGHTLIDVCAAPNNFERLIVNKNKMHAFGYRQSRKLMWGDLWRFPKRIIRRDARDYAPEKVKLYIDRLKDKAWAAKKNSSVDP
jgi:ribosomal protein RSM22 (predicted rRNA methylase)